MMQSVKPKSTTLEAWDQSVSLVLEFGSPEEADRAFDEIAKAMKAGTLVVSCGAPSAIEDRGETVQ